MAISVVDWSSSVETRPGTVLVVGLHGRGADERSMAGLAAFLPTGVTVAAPRGPIDVGTGFAWFANRGIGRPIEESIKRVGQELFSWLDSIAAVHPKVFLLGFSGGTAMAAGMLLAEPERFAGSILLSGTLPWDAGYDMTADRLSGRKVFWGNDQEDEVIPADLVARSERWLLADSGADLTERHYRGIGHSISPGELADVAAFISGAL